MAETAGSDDFLERQEQLINFLLSEETDKADPNAHTNAKITFTPPTKKYFCDLHKNENIVLYCDFCNNFICKKCLDTIHKDHNLIYYEEAVKNAEEITNQLLKDLVDIFTYAQENLKKANKWFKFIDQRAISDSIRIRESTKEMNSGLKTETDTVEEIRDQARQDLSSIAENFRTVSEWSSYSYHRLSSALFLGLDHELVISKNQAAIGFQIIRLTMPLPIQDFIGFSTHAMENISSSVPPSPMLIFSETSETFCTPMTQDIGFPLYPTQTQFGERISYGSYPTSVLYGPYSIIEPILINPFIYPPDCVPWHTQTPPFPPWSHPMQTYPFHSGSQPMQTSMMYI